MSSHESLDDGVVVLSNQPSSDTVQHDDDVQVGVSLVMHGWDLEGCGPYCGKLVLDW